MQLLHTQTHTLTESDQTIAHVVLNVDFLYCFLWGDTLFFFIVKCRVSDIHDTFLQAPAIFAVFHFSPADDLSLFVNLLTTTASLKLRFGVLFHSFSYVFFSVAFTTTLFLVSMTGS